MDSEKLPPAKAQVQDFAPLLAALVERFLELQQSREAAQAKQREVRRSVQSCSADVLQDLLRKRDLQRVAHAQALRSALSTLIKDAASGVPVQPSAAGAETALAALKWGVRDAVARAREIA